MFYNVNAELCSITVHMYMKENSRTWYDSLRGPLSASFYLSRNDNCSGILPQ